MRTPEENRSHVKKWAASNPERAKARSKNWRELNPERYRKSIKEWKKQNRSRIAEITNDYVGNLSSGYVRNSLKIPSGVGLPQTIIEAKRAQLKLLRASRSKS